MKRYLSAFTLTFVVYGMAFVLFLSYVDIKKTPIKLNENRVMALNHISLIQQKEVIKPKSVKEEKKQKKQPEKKLKEITTITQKVKEAPLKKTQPKVLKKKLVKKSKPKEIEEKKELKQAQPKLVKTAIKRDYKKEFINEHLKRIVKLIQQQMYYPKRARRFNIQGEVLIEFTLTKEGRTKDYKTLQGHKLLQKSTIQAIQKASRDFPRVKRDLRLVVPVVYELS